LTTRDSFERQTGPLQRSAGTQRLQPLARTPTRPLLAPDALRAQTQELLAKARATVESLEPRVEILYGACQTAQVAVPGLGVVALKHPLSPKGEQIVNYLAGATFQQPEWRKEVLVAIFRFYEATRLIEVAQGELDRQHPQQHTLEELKLQVFYLCRFHEIFKNERVLAQLFPAPQTLSAPSSKTELNPVERLKQKKQRDEILGKAEILRASLAPRMPTLIMTVEMIEKGTILDVRSLLTGTTRTVRLIAMGISTSPDLVKKLQEARGLYEKLETQLKEAKAGGDVLVLKDTIFPLSRLALTCRQHALLRDLFPPADEGLFPEEEPAPAKAATSADEPVSS
jgi:hypothetical protein